MIFIHNYGIYMIYKIKNNYDNKSREEHKHLSSDYILNVLSTNMNLHTSVEEKWGCYSMRYSDK